MSDPETMTTYRRADGELIYGEFSFVTDRTYLEEADEEDPTEYVCELWTLTKSETLHVDPPLHECTVCDDDGESVDAVTWEKRSETLPSGVLDEWWVPVCEKHRAGESVSPEVEK